MRRDWGEGGGDGTNKGGGNAGGGLVECLPGVSEGEEDGSQVRAHREAQQGVSFLFRKPSSAPSTVTW